MFIYIYENHYDENCYVTECEQTDTDLYCSECNSSDQFVDCGQPKDLLDRYLNLWEKILDDDYNDEYDLYYQSMKVLNILKAISPYLDNKENDDELN